MARVLVVDDEAVLRTTFNQLLLYGGHESVLAEDVESAKRELQKHDIDVVIADINMPGGQSGIDLLKMLHEQDSDIAVVLVTGSPSVETAREAVHAGAFDYISKPFNQADEFLKIIAGAARQAALRKENRRLDRENEEYRQRLEEKVAEQVREIAEKERQLQQAQRLEAIGTLAAGIAHEINTPVQFISDIATFLAQSLDGLLQLVQAYRKILAAAGTGEKGVAILEQARAAEQEIDLAFIESEKDNAVGMTREGIEQVTKIVGAMREFSHMAGAEMTKTDLNRAIESTVTISRNEWKYVAELKTDLAPDLPMVPCVPGDIKQVLLNLLINAAHAIADVVGETGGKGRITVSSREEGGMVVISVADTGTGIPKEVQPRIFDPFFTTKAIGKGTGQGLSMAYSTVVQKHNGKLTFRTEPGKGTTFFVRLPV